MTQFMREVLGFLGKYGIDPFVVLGIGFLSLSYFMDRDDMKNWNSITMRSKLYISGCLFFSFIVLAIGILRVIGVVPRD